jgi:hypothetical protein
MQDILAVRLALKRNLDPYVDASDKMLHFNAPVTKLVELRTNSNRAILKATEHLAKRDYTPPSRRPLA